MLRTKNQDTTDGKMNFYDFMLNPDDYEVTVTKKS